LRRSGVRVQMYVLENAFSSMESGVVSEAQFKLNM
jgi:hypothetical protein